MGNFIGLDVSKNWLDICIYSAQIKPQYYRYSNDNIGWNLLLGLLKDQQIQLIICEPTGGYEQEICQKLASYYPVHLVNTYSFNLFSKSINLSKTDKEDAYKLAFYGDRMQLKANYQYQEIASNLKRYQQRREDLVIMLSNEKKRLYNSVSGIDRESIEDLISYLEQSIIGIETKLKAIISSSKDLSSKVEILSSIPGIGYLIASKLVSFVPELGDANYTSNQLSALVGLAPYARDSGNKSGKRFIRGGRKIPRDALYMAVLTGRRKFKYLWSVYKRLIDNFKAKKVAIVACMRKLLELCHKMLIQKRKFVL